MTVVELVIAIAIIVMCNFAHGGWLLHFLFLAHQQYLICCHIHWLYFGYIYIKRCRMFITIFSEFERESMFVCAISSTDWIFSNVIMSFKFLKFLVPPGDFDNPKQYFNFAVGLRRDVTPDKPRGWELFPPTSVYVDYRINKSIQAVLDEISRCPQMTSTFDNGFLRLLSIVLVPGYQGLQPRWVPSTR